MPIETRLQQYGKVFDSWYIGRKLGCGSNGQSAVFELYRDNNGWRERSALKVISLIEERGQKDTMPLLQWDEYSTAAKARCNEAEEEVRLMYQVKGKTNIVGYEDYKFFDWSDETGFGTDLLIRMELLSDLRSMIKRLLQENKFLTEKEIVKVGQDVCRALVICHGKGILHRDIKPENIFISKDGDYKLGDFGVSRMLSNTSAALASTGIGTPAYSAPEQFTGHYDQRVDIYSLGLVLYELSNRNRLPFAASSYARQEDVQKRQMGMPLPRPAQISEGLWQVLRKACAYGAADRYGSAEEFLEALCRLESMKGLVYPKPAVVPQKTYQTVKADRMGGQYGTQKAGTWTGGTATQYAAPRGMVQNSAGSIQHPKTERRRKKGIFVGVLAGIAAVAAVALLFLLREGHEHTWLEATCTAPRTCEECGEMQGSALGHSWLEATCTSPRICESCRETEGRALGHSWLEATCTAPRICESCGETEGSALEHSWLEATCTDPRICSVCQKTEGTALGHQWVDATLTAPKTCANCRITSGESKLTTILAEAEQYAAEREYRQAIELLDNAWMEYEERQFYDLAADYRREFGIYNTSLFAVGKYNTVLLSSDGRVEICGDETHGEYKADNWTNIVAVSAGDRHVVGLTKYGTVVADGNKVNDECNVSGWSNIIAISAGDVHTVVLSKDGVVDATGYDHEGQCAVENLMRDAGQKQIVAIAAGYGHTLALLENGRVVACGGNSYGECNVYGWEDIVAIYAGSEFSAGLKADGTVVVTGQGTSAWDLSDWTDIVNLAAGDYYLIGVKANGDVLSLGINSADNPSEGQTNVSGMRDIVFAGAGNDHTVFLDSDGVLWCIGSNQYGQCNFHGRVLK